MLTKPATVTTNEEKSITKENEGKDPEILSERQNVEKHRETTTEQP